MLPRANASQWGERDMRTAAPGTPFLHGYGGASSSATAGSIGNGVVVVGFVGKTRDDLSQLLDRLLDQRIFSGIPIESRRYASESDTYARNLSWIKSKLRHYHDVERGILYVMLAWGSIPLELLKDDDISTLGLPALLDQQEMFGIRALLFMFSVCHILLMVQDGARFDPKLLRLFRVLQAAKTAILPSTKTPLKSSTQTRGFHSTGRQSSTLSGVSHTLFPGQCTPVLLVVCLDEFSDLDTSTPISDGSLSPVKLKINAVRSTGKPERKKFQSAVEAQVRFLIKKCRTLLGFGESSVGSGVTSRGAGGFSSNVPPALFTMDPSKVVLFVDKSSSRCSEALEDTISILENILKGKPNSETAFWEPATLPEDIQILKEFIWRQAEIVRGRGGNSTMSPGVGMVAVAAAAAAASAASTGSTGGFLRPISNPPELPTYGSWLAASSMLLSSLMKPSDETGSFVSTSKYRRTSLDNSRNSMENDLACLDSITDMNMKFSASWCRKSLPAARAVYLKGLPACYPTAVHEHQLEKALNAFRGMVRGPAVNFYLEKLKRECKTAWKSGRQLCDAVSLTGRPCTDLVHELPDGSLETSAKPHSSGVVFLSACACGRSRKLRDDPFDFDTANLSFFWFPNCEDNLQFVTLPNAKTPWSIVRLGNAKYYQPSTGLVQGGFVAEQNYLLHYDLPVFTKSSATDLDKSPVSRAKKTSEETKGKISTEKQKSMDAPITIDYNEESAFPPLPQKNGPKVNPPSKKATARPVPKQEKAEVVDNGSVHTSPSPLSKQSRDSAGMGLYVGFEHECPRGHRYFLSVEHLQKLGPPYSQQAGVEKKTHKRNRMRGRTSTYAAKTSERSQDGVVSGVYGSLGDFISAMENLSVGEGAGDGRVLLNSDLPIFMECPHCKSLSGVNVKDDVNYAGTVSRLQRIFLVTPPFPVLMASCPVVQFDESTTTNAINDLRFSIDCEVVLPPDSFLSIRLPFVYCVQNQEGSLLPLLYNPDHPELTAWLVKGTSFYVKQ